MNFEIEAPSFQNDTLDFYNVNTPFLTLSKNQKILDMASEDIREENDSLRVFTDKDEISVKSNGIRDLFFYDFIEQKLVLDGQNEIEAQSYTKKDTDAEFIADTTPLNMKETRDYMESNGFLLEINTFDSYENKRSYPFSNFSSMQETSELCIERGPDEITLLSPLCETDYLGDYSFLSRIDAENNFIHKTKTTDQISIKNDSIIAIYSESTYLYDAVFSEEYIPKSDRSVVFELYITENAIEINKDIECKIHILNESSPLSPVSLKTLKKTSGDFIRKTDNGAIDIEISRSSETISDLSVLSYDESSSRIDKVFDDILNPVISSFDEFKTYLASLCDVGDIYLGSDMVIPEGKVYIGFDYNRMDSVFNYEAVNVVLKDTTGSYVDGMGIVFKSSNYFSFDSMSELNKYASYAQFVGLGFDISTDTIGQFILKMRQIVEKLCYMDVDVIPPEDLPEIPTFYAGGIVISPPNFIQQIIAPYISIILRRPIYIEPPVFFIINPPIINTSTSIYMNIFMRVPLYISMTKDIMIIPPIFSNSVYSSAQFDNPVGGDTGGVNIIPNAPRFVAVDVFRYYERNDGRVQTGNIYNCTGDCVKRVIPTYRPINMFEVWAVGTALSAIEGKFFWDSPSKQRVLSLPQIVGLFITDVFRYLDENYKFPSVSIRVDNMFGYGEPESDESDDTEDEQTDENESTGQEDQSEGSSIADATCSNGNASGISSYTSLDIGSAIDGLYLESNGVVFYADGRIEGDGNVSETEMTDGEPSFSDFGKWAAYCDDEYLKSVRDTAVSIGDSIEEYYKRIKIGSAVSSEFNICSSEYALSGSGDDSTPKAMAEYLDADSIAKLNTNISASTPMEGFRDPILDLECTSIVDIAEGFMAYVPLGSAISGEETEEEYVENPPPLTGGNTIIRLWKPLYTPSSIMAIELPAMSLSDSNSGAIANWGPVIYITEPQDKDAAYEYSLGESLGSGGSLSVDVYTDSFGYDYHSLVASFDYQGSQYESSIIFGRTDKTQPPIASSSGDILCDEYKDFVPPYQFSGSLYAASNFSQTVPTNPGGTILSRVVGTYMNQSEAPVCDCSSGIDGTVKTNISDLSSILADTGEQEAGDVPALVSIRLNMTLSKFENIQIGSYSGVSSYTSVSVMLMLGCVDGMADSGGDILAQNLTEDELSTAAGSAEKKCYLSPNEITNYITSFSRVGDGSLFSINMSSLANEVIIQSDSGVAFGKVAIERNGGIEYEDSTVVMNTSSMDPGDVMTSFLVLVSNINTPGFSMSYKHAGPNPSYPIVTGYNGNSEISFFDQNRIAGTTPTIAPNVIYTGMDSGATLVPNIDTRVNNLYVFVNTNNIEIYIADSFAPLSQNRTLKVMLEMNEDSDDSDGSEDSE